MGRSVLELNLWVPRGFLLGGFPYAVVEGLGARTKELWSLRLCCGFRARSDSKVCNYGAVEPGVFG